MTVVTWVIQSQVVESRRRSRRPPRTRRPVMANRRKRSRFRFPVAGGANQSEKLLLKL